MLALALASPFDSIARNSSEFDLVTSTVLARVPEFAKARGGRGRVPRLPLRRLNENVLAGIDNFALLSVVIVLPLHTVAKQTPTIEI
jgi:hypothetical protein